MNEQALCFECAGERLVGILHPGAPDARRGLVIVVGGPQYRVGSHRQFVSLARAVARAGVPVLRFDYRGLGDAEGVHPGFERIGPDIAAAIDALLAHAPGLREVALWGLCDAASAALLYAHRDLRVRGLVLANPWVRTEASAAETYLRHYYLVRLFSRDFWRKVFSGGFRPIQASSDLLQQLVALAGGRRRAARRVAAPLPQRMLDGLAAFHGRVLLILSGNDLVAAEFRALADRAPGWRDLLARARVTRRELPEATHTFSSRVWRDQVSGWTAQWLASW